ncbi:MAG: type II toxin-antitoxin system RelE/ParE family toxin [Candidatus Riflebacteria bacterium]|nr:type II toxin-antitoxin system RelE/ParE family toxin [Candidatus Riflebacteria bacterium]
MALEVVWSPRALWDLRQIRAFIAADSPGAADVFCLRLVEMSEEIGQFPEAGRVVPEIDKPEVRERIIGAYRMVYRVGSAAVEIAAISHGARLLRI